MDRTSFPGRYDRHTVPARVRSIGALATIFDVDQLPGRPDPPEPEPGAVRPINILLRPFAKLAEGVLAIGPPGGPTVSVSPDHLSELAATVEVALEFTDLPSDHRRAHWAGVLMELEKLNVHTDPETLMALPFDFVPDGELRERLHRS